MALIHRISQLFRADLHAVLDQIEEPEQLLKQAVRDMEDELAGTERRIALRSQDQEALAGRKKQIQALVTEWDEQLDLCFDSGKDDLARSLVRRKLEAGRLIKGLDARMAANQRFLDEERRVLDENRATLEGLRQKAELIVPRNSGAANEDEAGDLACLSAECRVGDDEVEIAFLREKAARSTS